MSQLRRMLMSGGRGENAILPAGYTRLLYIQSPYGKCYINTGVNATSSIRIVTKSQWCIQPTGYEWLFGARDSNMAHRIEDVAYNNYTGYLAHTGYGATVPTITDFNEHTVDISQQRFIIDGTEYSNESGDQSSWSTSVSIYLFALNNNGSRVDYNGQNTCKLFYCKIYDGSTLIRDLIPCMNSSNVCGLYDVVNDVFYSSSTSVAFIGQKDFAVDSEGYKPYLWLNGEDEAVSGNWVDRVLNTKWALTNATHGTDYYEFDNPTSGVASKYATLANAGTFINLGTKWKIEAELLVNSSSQSGTVIDLCAYGNVSTKGFGISINLPNGSVNVNTKPNGNTAIAQSTDDNFTPVVFSDTWTSLNVKAICEDAGNDTSIITIYVNGDRCRYTNTFPTVEWKYFRNSQSPYFPFYIARGTLNSSTYHSPLKCRIKNIKISLK